MKKLLIFAMFLLLLPWTVAAQTDTPTPTPTIIPKVPSGKDCGWFVPCGPIPWSLPQLPPLASPTMIPTIQATFLANPVGTPTATPTPTPTAFFDNVELEDSLATYQAVVAGTPLVIENLEGTPVSSDDTITEVTLNVGTFFSYLKGLTGLNLGWTGVLIGFALTLFIAFMAVKMITIFIPVFLAILGLFRRIYDVIMEFIPL